jgi:hypothetical protein
MAFTFFSQQVQNVNLNLYCLLRTRIWCRLLTNENLSSWGKISKINYGIEMLLDSSTINELPLR